MNWLFGAALSLLLLSAIARIAEPFIPKDIREAVNDPTTVYFGKSETNGRECREMAAVAKERGAKHWVCWK